MDINFLFMALKGKRFSHLILDGNYPSHAFLGLPLIDKYVLFLSQWQSRPWDREKRENWQKIFENEYILCGEKGK